MLRERTAGTAMLAVGAVGLLASLVGGVVGWVLVGRLDAALDRSLVLTTTALGSVDAALTAGDDLVAALDAGFADAEATARGLAATTGAAERLLADAADLARDDVAGSLEAVQSALPALEQVASAIDATLSALDALPIGPTYDPDVPFDVAVRRIRTSLDGLPAQLRDQADLLEAAGTSLDEVGAGAADVADDLAALAAAVDRAQGVLDDYDGSAAEARALIDQAAQDRAGQRRLARLLVVLLAAVLAAGQLVPLHLGWSIRTATGSTST